MYSLINFHHLYYFWTIASEGSISKACKKLRLAQPTLSTQLHTLEEHLGHKLFDRRNRSLFLTQVGKTVYDYASEIFHLGRELQSVVHNAPRFEPKKISVGILSAIPKYTIHLLLKELMKKKKIFVTLREGNLENLLRDLEYHRLDLILSDTHAPNIPGKQFYSTKIRDYQITLVGNEKFRHLKKNFPQSLNRTPVILLTQHSQIRVDLDQYFKATKIYPDILGEIEDVALLRLFALSGVALVPLPQDAVISDLKSKQLFTIGELPSVTSGLWAITSDKHKTNLLVSQLIQQFKIKCHA